MAVVVLRPEIEKPLLEQVEAEGTSRYDEVWDGVYVMSPLPNFDHRHIANLLATKFTVNLEWNGQGIVLNGCNVSDREEGWRQNFREPDVAVYLHDTKARNLSTHWVGGPCFAVEIASPGDWTRKKIPFYAAVRTRELLIVDRDPWRLELYRLEGGELSPVGMSNLEGSEEIASAVLPLTFRLVPGEPRPRIEVSRPEGEGHRLA